MGQGIRMSDELYSRLKSLLVQSSLLKKHRYSELTELAMNSPFAGDKPLDKLAWDIIERTPPTEQNDVMRACADECLQKKLICFATNKALKEMSEENLI